MEHVFNKMKQMEESLMSKLQENRSLLIDQLKQINEKIDSQIGAKVEQVPSQSTSNLDPCIRYEHCCYIGDGVSGEVSKVYDKVADEYFAMKCVPLVDNTLPPHIAREISLLYDIDHVNIIKLMKVHPYNSCMYLLMEDAGTDLHRFLENEPERVTTEIIKDWLRQLFSGLSYLHERGIIHRDLKAENIIIGRRDLKLKICDFGSARRIFDVKRLTRLPGTLLFLAPELLLGDDSYAERVDMWAAGCIFYEMVKKENPFGTKHGGPSVSPVSTVLTDIFRKIGKPKEGSKLCSLPGYPRDEQDYPEIPDLFHSLVPGLDADGIDLLKALLAIDPTDRITADQALNHPYLKVSPGEATETGERITKRRRHSMFDVT